jgi:hypothetical protein
MVNKGKQQTQSSLDDMRVSEDNLIGVTGGLMATPEMLERQNKELAKHGTVVGQSKDIFGQPVQIYSDGTRVFRNGLGPLSIRPPSH